VILGLLVNQTLMKIKLQHVDYMPKDLKSGVLYVSNEFSTAAHLCPCGCASKIRIPLGPTEWTLKETEGEPTLWPSIGNWHLPCQSHYWITGGKVIWAPKWTPEQIIAGRQAEQKRRDAHYDNLDRGTLRKLWRWVRNLLKR
jgi:hypothetical protein